MAEPFRVDYPSNPYRVDPLYIKMTTPRTTNDDRGALPSVRDLFGQLSVTSQFKTTLFFATNPGETEDINSWLSACGIFPDSLSTLRYEFMCHSAVLPGATFSMTEEVGSRQGISEKFPIMRQFADLTLEFYVDSDYNIIRLFEEWINFINPLYTGSSPLGASERGSTSNRVAFEDSNFYRMRYPNTYKREIAVTKFERDFEISNFGDVQRTPSMLTYRFVNAFPTNLTALPVSYEGSQITKTTVTFNYDRYTVMKHFGTGFSKFNEIVTNNGERLVSASPQIVSETGSPVGQNKRNIETTPAINSNL